MRPPQETGRPAQPVQPMQAIQPVVAGRVLNQPSRSGIGPPSAPASPAHLNNRSLNSDDADTSGLPPQGAGFFSARAAAMVPEGAPGDALPPSHINNLPAFNPHLESPSIKRTPGIDHKSSKPLTRDLKHVPSSSQIPNPGLGAGIGRGSVVNPQLDATRRIGAPGMGIGSPMQNRGSYKPPTMKRPVDTGGGGNRAPLGDLPPNGPIAADGADAKRQRLSG
jgi:DNA repair and recombination protein RAD52